MILDALLQNVTSQFVPLSPWRPNAARAVGPPGVLRDALNPEPTTEILVDPDEANVCESVSLLVTTTREAIGPDPKPGLTL